MLDLILLRAKEKGGNIDSIYESQKKRYKSTELVDKCVELDAQWKESKL